MAFDLTQQVFLITGPWSAGKTTVARLLATRFAIGSVRLLPTRISITASL
jgi:uridine kinase